MNSSVSLFTNQNQGGTGRLPLIKICDFGYSKSEDMSMPKSKVGTLACEFIQGMIRIGIV